MVVVEGATLATFVTATITMLIIGILLNIVGLGIFCWALFALAMKSLMRRASLMSAKALPLICSALSVFMNLSALALSKGLPGLLMLMAMSRSASLWRWAMRRIGRIQTVVATPILLTYRNHASSASAGVFQPSVFRGLALRAVATAAISSALCTLRSVPFGKY